MDISSYCDEDNISEFNKHSVIEYLKEILQEEDFDSIPDCLKGRIINLMREKCLNEN